MSTETTVLPYFNQPAPEIVPMVHLEAGHKRALMRHFLALTSRDRYLRFGYAISDEQMQNYINQIDFDHDEIFGIFNHKLELIAVAHIGISRMSKDTGEAEFGVSVIPKAQGKGFGYRLFQRAVLFARNHGIQTLTLQCLSENGPMMHIVRKAGMIVQSSHGETMASLEIPPANLPSVLDEWMQSASARADLAIKKMTYRAAAPG